jgi:predicted metal-dependent hydrolase
MKSDAQPLIVAFVGDLFFTVKIENVARNLGFRVELIETAEAVAPPDENAPANQAAEPVYGRLAALVDKLTQWQPALLIFDLANEAIPWEKWLAALKSSPATRRMPVLAFAPHVETELLKRARALSADGVVVRSRFMSALPDLIQQYAKVTDTAVWQAACAEPLSELARKGIAHFNAGHYFEAHEELEDGWNEDTGDGRDLYRAILQVAVAYLQIERGNYAGAVKMFLRARQWLDPLPDQCRGVNIAQLRRDAEAVYQQILELGPENIGQFDRNSFPPVRTTD